MDWEALAAIAAIALAIGTAVGVVWRGGRMAERFDGLEERLDRHEKKAVGDFERHEERLDDHAAELKRGVGTFASLTTKVDLVLSQQGQILTTLNQLARKEH